MTFVLPSVVEGPQFDILRRTVGLDMRGPSAFAAQKVLQNAYSPRIAVIESKKAQEFIKQSETTCNRALEFFGYFEEAIALQTQRVKFVEDVLIGNGYEKMTELFEPNKIENDLGKYINEIDGCFDQAGFSDKIIMENTIYLKLLSQIMSNESISPFDCFNHPVMRLFVVSGDETIDEVNSLIHSSMDLGLIPKWVDLSSIKHCVFALVDENNSQMFQNALSIQESLEVKLIIVPVPSESGNDVSLKSPFFNPAAIELSSKVYKLWKSQLLDLINKEMLPFINSKVKQWVDEVVTPKKSLTNRLFNTKKWGASTKGSFFSFGNKNNGVIVEEEPNYNIDGEYYLASSPEMIIKKLGDWYFMLQDYKNAYSMYDLVKKDMTNDKAFFHLTVLQENTIASLLLGSIKKMDPFSKKSDLQQQQQQQQQPLQPITVKMISETITPAIESTFYSYLSKYNLKTHSIRMSILVAEYYFLLGQSLAYSENKPSNSFSLTSIYFSESINLFKKLVDSKLLGDTINSQLMLRIACIYYCFDRPILNLPDSYAEEDEVFQNPLKLDVAVISLMGRKRSRKSILWMLLAAKEMDSSISKNQIRLIIEHLESELASNTEELAWLERENSILQKLKELSSSDL